MTNIFYVEAQIGGGYDHYNTQRAAIDGFAFGNTGGYEFDSKLGGCYDFKCGQANSIAQNVSGGLMITF